MNIGGLRVGRMSQDERAELLAAAVQSAPSYDFVGLTLDPLRWGDPRLHSHSREVGRGEAAFVAARQALQTWVAQRGIGAEVVEPAPAVEEGATVLIIMRRGPLSVIAPNRVVQVIEEPRRFAFAYGSLDGHAEYGEESFTAQWEPDDTVRVTVRVLAGPATLAARATAPLVRILQRAAIRGYLRAIAKYVKRKTSDV